VSSSLGVQQSCGWCWARGTGAHQLGWAPRKVLSLPCHGTGSSCWFWGVCSCF